MKKYTQLLFHKKKFRIVTGTFYEKAMNYYLYYKSLKSLTYHTKIYESLLFRGKKSQIIPQVTYQLATIAGIPNTNFKF